jgi:hypothetical protein
MERVEREKYTKQLKNSIMQGLENQTEAKKKVLAIRWGGANLCEKL